MSDSFNELKPKYVFRDEKWVTEAISKQFEAETGYSADIDVIKEHMWGERWETIEYHQQVSMAEFKGINFGIIYPEYEVTHEEYDPTRSQPFDPIPDGETRAANESELRKEMGGHVESIINIILETAPLPSSGEHMVEVGMKMAFKHIRNMCIYQKTGEWPEVLSWTFIKKRPRDDR